MIKLKRAGNFDVYHKGRFQYESPDLELPKDEVKIARNCLLCYSKFLTDSKFVRRCKKCNDNDATFLFEL